MWKFNPKNWSSLDWLKYGTGVDYHIYTYFDFNVYFSLGKFGPTKSEICQIKWNLVQGYIVYAYFDLNVYFFKIIFIYIFFWQIWSQNVKFFKLTKIWYIGRFYCLFFQIFCHSYSFRQIWSQNLKFFKLTEMSYFDVYFFKILIIHIFGLIWSHKLRFSILTEIWCSVALLYA